MTNYTSNSHFHNFRSQSNPHFDYSGYQCEYNKRPSKRSRTNFNKQPIVDGFENQSIRSLVNSPPSISNSLPYLSCPLRAIDNYRNLLSYRNQPIPSPTVPQSLPSIDSCIGGGCDTSSARLSSSTILEVHPAKGWSYLEDYRTPSVLYRQSIR